MIFDISLSNIDDILSIMIFIFCDIMILIFYDIISDRLRSGLGHFILNLVVLFGSKCFHHSIFSQDSNLEQVSLAFSCKKLNPLLPHDYDAPSTVLLTCQTVRYSCSVVFSFQTVFFFVKLSYMSTSSCMCSLVSTNNTIIQYSLNYSC